MKGFIVPIIVGVVGLGGGFFGGVAYQKNQTPAFPGREFLTGGAVRQMAGPGGAGGGMSGTVQSKDDKSLMIKTANGSTETVYYSSSTTITKDAAASVNDVTDGAKVSVIGEPNADDSITAKSIRLTD